MRALIVDDEAPARAKLVRFVRDDGRFEIAGEAVDGVDAVAKIDELHPDLVLLDIQMPGFTGFEVLEAIGTEVCPKIVFTTAHDRYALDAFDAHAVDYLLKPFDAQRFTLAIDKVVAQLRGGGDDKQLLEALLAKHRGPCISRLLIKRGDGWIPIPVDRVRRLSADGKHVRVHTSDGVELVRDSLGVLESRLDPARFVRVHRGDIVNVHAVTRMDPLAHGDAVLELDDGSSVVLSRTHREAFLSRWQG